MVVPKFLSESKRYRVLGKIGEGQMSDLYLIEDQSTGRKYCLKLIPPDISARIPVWLLARGVIEASKISHPNIANTYEFGYEQGQAYVVREFVPGRSLNHLVNEHPLPLNQVVSIAGQSCLALAAAHSQGVAHAVLKPSNIVLSSQRQVKIVDLGIGELQTALYWMGEPRLEVESGARDFLAPEIYPGYGYYNYGSASADLYSLGAVMYNMATGQNPSLIEVEGSAVEAILQRLQAEREERPAVVTQMGDREAVKLGEVIDRLLRKDPSERIRSADELISELQPLSDRAISGYITGWAVEEVSAPAGRHVNAWLVDRQLPLEVGTTYQIGVDIGVPRQDTVAGGTFTEPQWGDKTHLELLIALNSLDAEVSPEWKSASLPKHGNMGPVFFEIVPLKEEAINLSLSIYLARDLTLLEKYRMVLPTVKVMAEVKK